MGEAKRRKDAGTYPDTTKPNDDDERFHFLQRPDVQSLIDSPEGRRLLRPGLLKFLAAVGVQPQVDAATGELVVDGPAIIAALGLNEAEELEKLGEAVRVVPADRLKPLQ